MEVLLHLLEHSEHRHRVHGGDDAAKGEDLVDVHRRVDEPGVDEVEAEGDGGGGEGGAKHGQGEHGGQLRQEGRVVEVVGGVQDDGGDEDGVDGEVGDGEGVQGRHVPRHRGPGVATGGGWGV